MADNVTACPATSGINPPAPLVLGSHAREDWIRWKEDWLDYAVIQDVASKPSNIQLALFHTALGTEGKKTAPKPTNAPDRRRDTHGHDTARHSVENHGTCCYVGGERHL